MSPGELLDAADAVLHEPGTASGGWPRMVALLTRQALEKAIDEFWDSHQETAGVSRCKRRTQLVCLPFYLDARLALEASYVWAALSDACHYHAYELAPTAGELARWIDVVAGLIESIDLPVKGPG